jgi:hypothetical protein
MMKQRFYGIRLLVTALAALALGGPATAGEQVPFEGSSSGVVTVTGVSYPFVTVSLVGEGVATHLGSFTVSAVVVLDVSIDIEHGGIPTGMWTLTAANGDQLFLAMGGHGIDATHGFGAFTVVGGTGRFQGATGYYEQIITFPTGRVPPVFPYTDVLVGTISSPGSNQ